MLKIIAFILLIGLIALGFAFCVAGQVGEPLPKYDMNGDGYVNVQDIDLFVLALRDGSGYITVQDINPFTAQINSAKPVLELYVPMGCTVYMAADIPQQEGLDPERDYIVCHDVEIYDGVKYIPAFDGRLESFESICNRRGMDPNYTTIIVVPTTQPSDNGVPDP